MFRRSWGISIFFSASLTAFFRLLHEPVPGHYRVFTRAAHAIWAGQNPYGTNFGTGVGNWFYSPSCALYFFGPLNHLPEIYGLGLYMLISWEVFLEGARALMRALPQNRSVFAVQWFWLMISFQIFGGILASKLEILMTGILMLCASWLATGRRRGLAAFLLAMIVNWKFQPLPAVGLLALGLLAIPRDWKWPLAFLGWLSLWYLAPLAVLRWDFLLAIHRSWNSTLESFVRSAWVDFENIFVFLRNALGIPVTYAGAMMITGCAGLTLAVLMLAWALHAGTKLGRINGIKATVSLALVWGTMFTVVFSPLGQNNALILWAPLLLVSVFAWTVAEEGWWYAWTVALVVAWAIMAVPYTDAVPLELRNELRGFAVKPLASLLLGAMWCGFAFNRAWLKSFEGGSVVEEW